MSQEFEPQKRDATTKDYPENFVICCLVANKPVLGEWSKEHSDRWRFAFEDGLESADLWGKVSYVFPGQECIYITLVLENMKATRIVKRQLASPSSHLMARHLGKMLQGVKCTLSVQQQPSTQMKAYRDLDEADVEDRGEDDAENQGADKEVDNPAEATQKVSEEDDEDFAFKPPAPIYPAFDPETEPIVFRPTTPHKNGEDDEPAEDENADKDSDEDSSDEEDSGLIPKKKREQREQNTNSF